MTIRTILLCFLCNRPYDVPVELFGGALGNPRYWCRDCLRPRNFSKRIRERMAALESQSEPLLGANAELWNALSRQLAFEEAFEDRMAETFAA